ncbi:MAG TPA: ABC transporter ATP-binding protein, partial [Spirochaetales bacterium]|nr:ABC transporter ATP-binding protein [Spirochaetales bacterium]
IRKINEEGVTVLLIEQNANVALRTAHQGYVMETGNITNQGPGRELLENVDIRAAYLGKSK